MQLSAGLLFILLNLTCGFASALSLNTLCLETKLRILAKDFNGRVGICVSDGRAGVSMNGHQRFPLHGVFKIAVAVAVLDAVDKGQLHLDEGVMIPQNDSGVGGQALAKPVSPNGLKTTIRDLLFRMIVASDGTATDLLVRKVGGPSRIQSALTEREVKGVKIDRSERDLDADGRRHDTGTPIGVANLLQFLANGQLLSHTSSALLLEAMTKARTSPDSLRAGLPNGWLLAHKTGTADTSKGDSGTTNDVGILMAPDASSFVVVVFIAGSRASANDRTALIAGAARAVGECSQ